MPGELFIRERIRCMDDKNDDSHQEHERNGGHACAATEYDKDGAEKFGEYRER